MVPAALLPPRVPARSHLVPRVEPTSPPSPSLLLPRNQLQVALDECNANLIRLQASSVSGEEYPAHVRAPVPAPAPEAQPAELAGEPQQAARKPAVGRKEAAPKPVKAADVQKEAAPAPAETAEEAAAPASAPAAAPKEAAAKPTEASETAIRKPALARKEAAGAPAVAPNPTKAAAPAPAPAAAEAAFQVTEARGSKKETADNPFELP